MGRIIFHVDMNSYFATVMQQENPTLRGKPVGIIKSKGRMCIIAASKEAKRLGIKTGERLPDALTKAPNLVLVPAQFDIMLHTTHQMKEVFHRYSPHVDIFSLDEAFLDLTGCELVIKQAGASSLTAYGRLIQEDVKRTLGGWITCNVGISHNKLLSKLAGSIAPKGEVATITQENLDDVLMDATFDDICGIGHRLSKRLVGLGVTTPWMINLLDDETLQKEFGPFWSRELRKIGRGEETHFFSHEKTVDHMQSVGRTITGYHPTDDEETIHQVLLNLLEEATYKLRKMDLAGRRVGISLWGHGTSWGAHRTLKHWVRHTDEIFTILYEELYHGWKRTFPVIKFGVWIGDLQPMSEIPLCLLPTWRHQEIVYTLMDRVNDRFGGFTLTRARLLTRPLIHPEVTGYLGDKKYLGLV